MRTLALILSATFITLSAAVAASWDLRDNERPIRYEELPAEAQSFIKSHFAKEEVSYAILDKGIFFDEYSVVLANGDKLDFDNKGHWTEVKCRYSAVPNDIVPRQISDYVKQYNPSAKIVEIKRERNEWEVKLSGGLEYKFNSSFGLVEVDD